MNKPSFSDGTYVTLRLPSNPIPAIFAIAALVASCTPDFTASSTVNSVRILAVRAEPPYAVPGAPVNLEVLAFDGRDDTTTPMTISWVPTVCSDPENDAFYRCYPGLEATSDPAGSASAPPWDTRTTFSFTTSPTAITAHDNSKTSVPFGTTFAFVIACAGTVRAVPQVSGGSPDANPFGCFDDHGAALDPNQFVFAYSQTFVFADRTNANPVLDHLTYGGAPIDPVAGITVAVCTKSNIDDCPTTPIDSVVAADQQELDPSVLDANGQPLHEQLYVDYFTVRGKLKDTTEILYDPRSGRVAKTGDDFSSPQVAGDFLFWAVLHDNRGGMSWLQVPLHAR